MTAKEIRKELREAKRDMKARGIRVISFMNGGLTREESRCNENLFRLKTLLEERIKQDERNGCKDGSHNWPACGGLCFCGEMKWKY